MKSNRLTYIKHILLPCVIFSMVTGVFTGSLIFGFNVAASWVMALSDGVYAYVRENPLFLPLLLLGAAALGLIAAFILRWEPNCCGGGIPTAIAQLRGLISFHWLRSLILLFSSTMITFFCGIPLGNEGPSVQMGTAVGRGVVRVFGRNNLAWDRYIMTGGACAGFAAATGAPLAGILFVFEEAHRRFTPMLFMVSASTAVFGTATVRSFENLLGMDGRMFSFSVDTVLPMESLWSVLIVGLVCGIVAVIFTKLYRIVGDFVRKMGSRSMLLAMTVCVFVIVAGIGFFSHAMLGSGHDLIETLLEGEGVWYLLLILLAGRALLLLVANNVGITGGVFLPTLAFGAMIGFLCARGLVALNLLGEEYTVILTTVGMAAFLGASSRIPLTVLAFSIEALCGLNNILPFAVGVTLAYLVIEVVGVEGFTEAVVDRRVAAERKGKTSQTVEADFVVRPGSFAVGKEVRDILWPPSCVILSVYRNPDRTDRHFGGMNVGDILHLHYTTYDPAATKEALEHLVGVQETNT